MVENISASDAEFSNREIKIIALHHKIAPNKPPHPLRNEKDVDEV
jgi:hypothetical protein